MEFATASWVEWFNKHWLLGPIGDIPPVEDEEMYHQEQSALDVGQATASGNPGAVHARRYS